MMLIKILNLETPSQFYYARDVYVSAYLLRQRGWLCGWVGGWLAGCLSHAGIVPVDGSLNCAYMKQMRLPSSGWQRMALSTR